MTTLPQTTSIRLPRPMGAGGLAVPGQMNPAAAPALGMTAGDVWRVLRANLWLILLALIVSGIGGFFLNMYLSRSHSRYTAMGQVQINPKRSGGLFEGGRDYTYDTSTLSVELKSQARLMTTDALLNAVLSRPAVRETSWFKQFIKNNEAGQPVPDVATAKQDLEDSLSVSPIPESWLIVVQFTYKEPADCATIVRELVEEHLQNQSSYQRNVLRMRTQDLNLTKSTLLLKSNSLKDRMTKVQAELNAAGIKTGNGLSIREIEMASMAHQLEDARLSSGRAQAELDAFTAQLKGGEEPVEVEEAVRLDQRLNSERQNVEEMEANLLSLESLGPSNPRYRSYQNSVAMKQKQLADDESTLRLKLRQAFQSKLEKEVAAAQSNMTGVGEKLNSMREETGQLDFKMFQFLSDKEDKATTDKQLEAIDKQLTELGSDTQSQDVTSVNWATNGRPEVPQKPSFPKLPFVMGGAIAVGLLLSLGIAFGRELMDQSVRSDRDIRRVGQMNLLGMIPHEDDDPQVAGVPLPMVIAQAPTSVIAEQFRQVRTRLQHASSLDTTRSILVTSPGPGDGKSTVAANLAAGLALNGRRILLVDANFRRPQLYKIFSVSNETGFSNVLGSLDNFETAVQQTSVPNLDVMPTGPKPANPTELMESQLLIDFIEKALEEYDHVVFDSGPLLFVSETVALAPRVDGVVTVVRARANSRGLLTRMRDGLRQLKAEHLGIILNAVRSQGGGYYGRNIKTYYEYQNGQAH